MATPLDRFYPLIAGKIRNCPDVMLGEALIASADEFCRRTRAFIEEDQVEVVAGERFVDLYAPEGEVLVVEQLRRDDWLLEQLSRFDFEYERYDVHSGSPRAYYVEGDRRLVLGPIPDADETLTARFTLRPATNASSLNDRLYTDWREGIAAGARAYLRRHHAPWADPQEEAIDRDFFDLTISRANLDRAQGGSRRRLNARGHYF